MSIEITEFTHPVHGKCISINNEIIKVDITIDKGPFIIYFGFINGKNLLYSNEGNHGHLGHHLWFNPKTIPESPSLEKSVVYTPSNNGVKFTQIIDNPINLKISIETLFAPETNDFMILHSVQNISKESKKISICASTLMNPNGILIVPQCNEDTELFPNRLLALWPYSRFDDKRFYLGNKYISFQHDSEIKNPFKFGTNNTSGWASYMLDNTVFIKRFVHNDDARYPDFGCSFESYSCDKYLSLNTNSAFYLAKPKEIIKHVENWSIFKNINNLKNCRKDKDIQDFFNNSIL